jgi:hypothetical protein
MPPSLSLDDSQPIMERFRPIQRELAQPYPLTVRDGYDRMPSEYYQRKAPQFLSALSTFLSFVRRISFLFCLFL